MGKNMHIQTETQPLHLIMKWIREAFTPSYQEEVEQYLSQATDLADLERRMYTISRRGML
jgi:hypothetical protein